MKMIYELVRKKEYCLADGCCSCQLSPRPISLMSCFIVSVECQVRLFEVLLLSVDGLMTVSKSPPIMILLCSWWRKEGNNDRGELVGKCFD